MNGTLVQDLKEVFDSIITDFELNGTNQENVKKLRIFSLALIGFAVATNPSDLSDQDKLSLKEMGEKCELARLNIENPIKGENH